MTPSIGHPGIFLNEFQISGDGHLDLPKLLAMSAPVKAKSFGVLDLWAYKRKEESPFLALNVAGNVEEIQGNSYEFEVLTAGDKSIKIIKDLSGSARPGYGGQPFELIVNRYIGAGARVKFDVTHPIELQAMDNSINIGASSQPQHKVKFKLVQNAAGNEYVPKQLLVEGSQLTVLAHTWNSEFGQKFPTWEASGASRKKFVNKISTAPVVTSYHITRQAGWFADYVSIDQDKVEMMRNMVMEYVQIDGAAENGITYLNDYLKTPDAQRFNKVGFNGIVSMYDDIALQILAKEVYNYQTWGSGGLNTQDGLDSQHFAPGVYFQLDFSGYKHYFSIDTFQPIEMLTSAVRGYFKDKVTIVEGQEPLMEVRTGDGGWELITEAFGQKLYGHGTLMRVTDFGGFVEGSVTNGLSINQPLVTGFRVPGVARFKVVKDSSLNRSREANDLINPIVPGTGHRLSSFTIILQDVNYASSNLRVLRPMDYGGGRVRMDVQNGMFLSHPMFTQSMGGNISVTQSTDNRTGFEAKFATTPDTVIVMDPTRLLKLVPKNPITGLGF